MLSRLDTSYDLYQWTHLPIIDVRSPSEFAQGHWPAALNIPLLNDPQRAAVGTAYKEQGHYAAVQLGFKLAGASFHKMIQSVIDAAPGSHVHIYCARGGLRSEIMEWMLEKSGLKVLRLEGGYKTIRHAVLEILAQPWPLRILGGATGSGKTDVLHQWRALQLAQVIDLEGLANHKGSAFGALGQEPQPSTEHFENRLAFELLQMDPQHAIWLEDESRMIGQVKIPDAFFDRMMDAPWALIDVDFDKRRQRIVSDYGRHPRIKLSEATIRVRKRLGNQRLAEALEALDRDDLPLWANIMLQYYDKYYHKAMTQHRQPPAVQATFSGTASPAGARKLFEKIEDSMRKEESTDV